MSATPTLPAASAEPLAPLPIVTPADGPRLYTLAEAGARLGGLTGAAVQNYIAAGRLRAVRLNESTKPRFVRVTAADLQAFIESLQEYAGQPCRVRGQRDRRSNHLAQG
ncbi:helix-turn-helix domain-containing protein [Limnoglobus roseus]|uniref:Helix-turn-helix domain-containing protein n=1 Tax=Limnoglobus roseus TaxID=2598579 RepID=A0A5C1AUI2_9BACT|nr:helix-turn-helix domain-containing protein [Limnoglobus roseus]QEL20438.1 hypothetical protein PX52LOC_07536 [Limnoglobus roseus]